MAVVKGLVRVFSRAAFREPLYVAVPLDFFAVVFASNKFTCQLTNLENSPRTATGATTDRSFPRALPDLAFASFSLSLSAILIAELSASRTSPGPAGYRNATPVIAHLIF